MELVCNVVGMRKGKIRSKSVYLSCRRKMKIQELVEKYRSHMSESEFFARLFISPSY